MEYLLQVSEPSPDYELIDSGNGEKLERFGKVVLVRPDPQALWKPRLDMARWVKADGRFVKTGATGEWKIDPKIPKEWKVKIQGLSFLVGPSAFKHVGVFPEHASHWKWIEEKIKGSGRKISVLNLFGYTGGATLAAAKAGADVCHVDASKTSVSWAKKNAELSNLKDAPIRWIVDDALAFLKREARRGNKYDAIIMDPPSFGRGPKGEVWKIEDSFIPLLEAAKAVLSEKPLFLLVNGYASGYSAIGYSNSVLSVFGNQSKVECGELAIADSSNRLLPAGIFARMWKP